MGSPMKAFTISAVLFALLLTNGANSQCSEDIEEETVDELVTSAIEEELSEGGGTVEVDLIAWNVNCLVAAPSGGYQFATITISYNVSGSAVPSPLLNQAAQLVLVCNTLVPLTPEWSQNPMFGLYLSTDTIFAGGGLATIEELLTDEANRSCLACNPRDAPTSPEFCSPCSEECSSIGLMQCYLVVGNEEICCSYFDILGNCVSDCGLNQVPSEDLVCTCTGFYGPPGQCDECQLTCRDGVPAGDCNSCICDPGYTGRICDEEIDECDPNPCDNGGQCIDGINFFTCICPSGYTGPQCKIDIDYCDPNPCERGTCVNDIDSFTCLCPPGFTGPLCGEDIDECDFNTCEEGGTCVNEINSFTCICPDGFTGQRCGIDIDDCEPNPCERGGTCEDGVNSFTCHCPTGFVGDTCKIDIDYCSPNPCLNEATCIDGLNGYECICAMGFMGENCKINIDDCDPNPCLNGGACRDQTLGYICECPIGRSGTVCELCADGFKLESNVCVKDCAPVCDLMEGEDTFNQDLCKFYCQLEFWRELASENGLMLPTVTPRNLDLSQIDQWNLAILERDRFDALWRAEAMGSGIDLTDAAKPPDLVGTSTFDRWKQLLETSLNEQATWQSHIAQTQQEIIIHPFDSIEDICLAVEMQGISPVYGSLLSTWSLQSAQCV